MKITMSKKIGAQIQFYNLTKCVNENHKFIGIIPKMVKYSLTGGLKLQRMT